MSTKNNFIFPTYVQMYPYSKDRPFLKQVREKLRYYGYKWLYQKQCSQLVDFLNTETQWQPLFTQDYYRINTILTTFCDKRFSASGRLTVGRRENGTFALPTIIGSAKYRVNTIN